MLCATKLSQHAVSQSEAREVRHTIPVCSNLDKLSQHAVGQAEAREVRHTIPAYNGNQSQAGKAGQAIPVYIVQTHYPSMHCEIYTCIKEAAKAQNSRQADTAK